ncbi:hypothetical protein [Neomicrococcus aestuarii]|uniref:Uncharacterized protein n=1 Tax=Neomicrococcus aestuarii TaxID=556325 RepID=A0A1L2ZMS3_9MICC|nr:hypothetical protein [Neomicrococcus aestuarii]APF40500.1 hypothetical protein BHE16_05095 [Neomicrococcus aestuarii]MBB5511403.1 hypothetical protein [Neomicrococcus aestuarii]
MALPSQELLSVLRCPVTKSALKLDGEELVATAPAADGSFPRYPVINSIPRLVAASNSDQTSGEDA